MKASTSIVVFAICFATRYIYLRYQIWRENRAFWKSVDAMMKRRDAEFSKAIKYAMNSPQFIEALKRSIQALSDKKPPII